MQLPETPETAPRAADIPAPMTANKTPRPSAEDLPVPVMDQIAVALLQAAAERHSSERLLLHRLRQAASAGRMDEIQSILAELTGESAAPKTA